MKRRAAPLLERPILRPGRRRLCVSQFYDIHSTGPILCLLLFLVELLKRGPSSHAPFAFPQLHQNGQHGFVELVEESVDPGTIPHALFNDVASMVPEYILWCVPPWFKATRRLTLQY